jgi:hypothetical protein
MAQNDEFIREVDEEYRRDQLAKVWERYNGIIIAVVVLIVAGVGGWRFWQYRQQTLAQEAAVRYEEALRLSSDDKSQEAQGALENVMKQDSGTGYAMLARFRLATELGKQNAENSASAFDALANDSALPALWKDLARLRAAWLRLDTAEPAALRQAVEPIAAPANAWRHSARELLGLSGLKAGDMDYAGRWFDQIAADRETPSALRQRLAVYTALVAGGPVQATQ